MVFLSGSFKYLFKHRNGGDSGEKSSKTNLKIPRFLVLVNCRANRYLPFTVVPLRILFLILSPLV